jgi:stage II sporulation protein P
MLRFLYGVCAAVGCGALLIAALIAVTASRIDSLWNISPQSLSETETQSADIKTADTDSGGSESLPLIADPGGSYALEFYDTLFYTEEGETPTEGDYKIITCDLSASSIYDFYNETSYTPDADALLAEYTPQNSAVYTSLSVTPEPLVLIIHTHGTEGFASVGTTSYSSDNLPRSSDITNNIVAVGRAMRDAFIANGIPALHCEIMHDKDSYNDSYKKSLATILAYLAKYPSIKYVFDVHRDAILGDGTMTKGVCDIGGTSAAQVMLVVGTNAGGSNYPDWQKNLAFALTAQKLAAEQYPGLMRQINIRKASFNAQYSYRDLLIEVGSCANTLDEAKAGGTAIANIISQLIKQGY